MSFPAPTVFVGIAGGTASGKTSLARSLIEEVGEQSALLLELDSYYEELGHLPLGERHRVNFDHPDAFDWELLHTQITELLNGQAIEVPVYDYQHHNRIDSCIHVEPRPVVILEGILVFWKAEVRQHMGIKVYVDTPADIRLMRRIRRDTVERGRSLDSVLEQYESFVRPAHEEFCEPTKAYADVIIPRGARNRVARDMVSSRLRSMVAGAPARPPDA